MNRLQFISYKMLQIVSLPQRSLNSVPTRKYNLGTFAAQCSLSFLVADMTFSCCRPGVVVYSEMLFCSQQLYRVFI